MHFVIMGCGRVGSTLAHILEAQGHRSPSSTSDRGASAGWARVRRPPGHRPRLRPGHPARGGIEEAARLRRGQQRRQLQHPRRPGRPRDLRRRQRRRPHLRPRPRRGLPAAGHPHGRDRPLDRRPDDPPAAPARRGAASGATRAAASCSPRSRSTRMGRRSGSAASRRRPARASRSSPASARGCCPTPRPSCRTATSSTS